MEIPPQYEITSEILDLLSQIEAKRLYLSSFDLPDVLKEKIQRISLLKSSLYSAKIEGNPLNLENIENTEKDKHNIEIFNIISATRFITKNIKSKSRITKSELLRLHELVMTDIGIGGIFRTEPGAIFNSAGVAVYLSPPPSEINGLIENLLNYINSGKEKFPLITALVSHLILEKIHPFIDGNGRVGRLLIGAILKAKGYDFKITIPFEEYLNSRKSDYYYYLDVGLTKTNDYLTFMLGAINTEANNLLALVKQEKEKDFDLYALPPRQEEVYYIVKDHVVVSFDFLKRRFLNVPSRTLRYDLKKLQDKGFLIKTGKTKGSYYKTVK